MHSSRALHGTVIPIPQPYRQAHDTHSGQVFPFYLLPTRLVPSTIHPTGQLAGTLREQMGLIAPITVHVVYSDEMLTSSSAVPPGATIQMIYKVVTTEGPYYPPRPPATRKVAIAIGSSPETKDYLKTTFARICVEMDSSKGFPAEIHLTSKDYVSVQKIDYENILFRCRSCYET